jgi:hypothetical protein
MCMRLNLCSLLEEGRVAVITLNNPSKLNALTGKYPYFKDELNIEDLTPSFIVKYGRPKITISYRGVSPNFFYRAPSSCPHNLNLQPPKQE